MVESRGVTLAWSDFMPKKYVVELSGEERAGLKALIAKGSPKARKARRARMLLKADQGPEGPAWTDERIAEALEAGVATVERLRERFVEKGLEAALERARQQRRKKPILDGEGEAKLLALACSKPPEGRTRWTLKLLAGKLVELEVVEAISRETVRRTLKKTSSSRGSGASGRCRRASPAPSS